MSFGKRLGELVDRFGPFCPGIDPHAALLKSWGLADDVAGLRVFAQICVEAFGGQVAIVKPQSAFFERFGSAGIAVLEDVLAGLREAGTLSLLDVKRGDIGSTMGGYADAYLSDASPLRADAITVSPYLGFGSVQPALDLAADTGRGVFVLALTSNPEAAHVQQATYDGRAVAADVIDRVGRLNASADRFGDVGMVVGATTGKQLADLGLTDALADAKAPLLAPGVGAQGATFDDVRRGFGPAASLVLPASSREVLAAGPDVAGLRQAARAGNEAAR